MTFSERFVRRRSVINVVLFDLLEGKMRLFYNTSTDNRCVGADQRLGQGIMETYEWNFQQDVLSEDWYIRHE